MRALLVRLNSHRVFFVGMGTGIASIAILGAQHQLDAIAHASTALRIARFWIDGLAQVAWVAITPALIAAGIGRPTTVK